MFSIDERDDSVPNQLLEYIISGRGGKLLRHLHMSRKVSGAKVLG